MKPDVATLDIRHEITAVQFVYYRLYGRMVVAHTFIKSNSLQIPYKAVVLNLRLATQQKTRVSTSARPLVEVLGEPLELNETEFIPTPI